MTDVTPPRLAWAILNNFSYISLKRFHNLAFLCEHQHYIETGERLTDTEYIELLDGFYNEELDKEIHNQSDLETKDIRLAGDEIEVITVTHTNPISLPAEVQVLVDELTEEWGESQPSEFTSYVKAVVPRSIPLTEELDFKELYDEPMPLYKRL